MHFVSCLFKIHNFSKAQFEQHVCNYKHFLERNMFSFTHTALLKNFASFAYDSHQFRLIHSTFAACWHLTSSANGDSGIVASISMTFLALFCGRRVVLKFCCFFRRVSCLQRLDIATTKLFYKLQNKFLSRYFAACRLFVQNPCIQRSQIQYIAPHTYWPASRSTTRTVLTNHLINDINANFIFVIK